MLCLSLFKLGEQLQVMVLKGYPYVEASLYSLYVPIGFGGRTGSVVSMSHVFPQSVRAAITC